jgi:hypothetical protein
MNLDNYKDMILDYYLVGYKWKDNLETITLKSNKEFVKLNKTGKHFLEIITVDVVYPYFKIVNLNVYILPLDYIILYNCNNPEEYNAIIDYINKDINKNKISKYNIKIIENDKIISINDDKFNILKLEDNIKSDKEYLQIDISVQSLINNVLEKG